jgi:tetratricopeptide (TPR) repeat protein
VSSLLKVYRPSPATLKIVSARARVYGVVAAVALAAAGLAVGVTLATRTVPPPVVKQKGVPPLVLDFGVRADPEARALARAVTLYGEGKRPEAAAIFERYSSPEAQVGTALAAWPNGSLARLQSLSSEHPRSALVRFYLGLAQFWEGQDGAASASFRAAKRLEPDTYYAIRADGLLHPRFAPGLPPFTPSFDAPAAVRSLPAAQQLLALRKAATAAPRSRLLYGAALQRLGRPLSAERQFRLAAAALPDDPEAQVAAAVGQFSKAQPAKAFSQLGPLAKRFPRAQTVRFHLGLMLLWMADVKDAKLQLQRALRLDPAGPLAPSARAFLSQLEKVRTS